MPKAKVSLNHKGIGQLLKSDEVARMLHERMERVAARARETAPVGPTGNYKAGIEVRDEVHKTRVVSRVVGTAKHSHLVEARTGNLARALDAAGGA